MDSAASSNGSVEQIKVEPDFYFPTADTYGQGDEQHAGDEDFDEEHQLKLDSSTKEITHTGEKPYHCEICNLRFTQSCNLQSHYRRNHGIDPKNNPQLISGLFRQQKEIDSVSTTNSAMGSRTSPSSWSQHMNDLPPLTPRPFFQGSQPFHCCVCEEPFFDRDLLLIHEETHVPEAPFECRFCSIPYSVLDDFRSHVNIHRINLRNPPSVSQFGGRQSQSGIRISSQGPVATRRASPSLDGANASLNQNKPFVPSDDSEYPYKCVECKLNFQKHQLYAHMKVHLKQKNIFSKKSIKCDECGKIFEKELTLKKHMDTAHPSVGKRSPLLDALQANAGQSTSAEFSFPSTTVKVEEEPESSLGDDEVNSTVSDNPILTQLLNNNSDHSNNSTSVIGDEGTSEGGFIISAVATVDQSFLEQLDQMERVQKHQQETEPDQHTEPDQVVQQVQPMPPLRRMPVLEESLRRPPVNTNTTHPLPLNSGPYRCSFCNKLFNEHFGLRQHLRAMHYSEKRHKCPECGRKFTLGISLATHRRVHTTVKPFTCIVCYKTFTRSTALNGHLSSHSYGRVKCAECGESQINVFNYMKHIEKNHPNFLNNVTSYRTKAETIMQHRREMIMEITRGLAEHRSEIPNILARLRGEVVDEGQEVSSSVQITMKGGYADSEQSEEVSSASEALPALRAELRKRPLRSNTRANELEEFALPPIRKSSRTAGSSSPNLKRLLEQNNSGGGSNEASQHVTVKSEPVS
ncbi:zinc finger protein 26-like isoform X2 [Toxorhynchites rutilus septentrionalis]|uniref:zinc finger protein 26-like isoform X2 n=1 Tax=Toxorhynchites rutilus septentrionalis TaxID=329112 RepID=UPI002478CCC2|nr:zinc finger protein 26-like isoform X2 [Toxorhynchites rutilus septentrionalis]